MKDISQPVRPKERFLAFGQPCLTEREKREITDSLNRKWIGAGPKVALFEEKIATYKKSRRAVAVSSCTAGLHLSCMALNLRPDDEVIVPALTFASSVNAIIHSGAIPVLADVDLATMNIDPDDIERKIRPETKAIMVVHMAGRACNMNSIMALAEKHDLAVIEDCAHAIETEYHGKKAGTIGAFGVLSFYATKNITTAEGGMVLTGDDALADQIKRQSLHGLSMDAWGRSPGEGFHNYQVVELGYKYNMTDLAASLGLAQLTRIEEFSARRKAIWKTYDDAFADIRLTLPTKEEPGTKHARHLYTVLVDKEKCGLLRDEFAQMMSQHNIGVGIHYLSIPEHPYYQKTFGWSPNDTPTARDIGRQTVSLPLSGCLGDDDIADVITAVRDILE